MLNPNPLFIWVMCPLQNVGRFFLVRIRRGIPLAQEQPNSVLDQPSAEGVTFHPTLSSCCPSLRPSRETATPAGHQGVDTPPSPGVGVSHSVSASGRSSTNLLRGSTGSQPAARAAFSVAVST